ncbi:MAG: hypothetical protein Q8S73_16365, partial [Deltaproteobacteria bacterium]|nr:hypothetical protein [Deltaproteobacteria bacterium]
MSDRSVNPPNGADPETAAEGERRARKSRRGLRIPTGTHDTLVTASTAPELELPDLEHEPLLTDTPVVLDTGSDVEITASDEVEVSVSETESAMITMPPPAPEISPAPESSMRVVRRRIRKVGSDLPPSDDGLDRPGATLIPPSVPPLSPDAPVDPVDVVASTPPEGAVSARPSRPPPPRAPARSAMISSSAASIFTAPTIPPMPDPLPPPGIGARPAPIPAHDPAPEVHIAPGDESIDFTLDPDEELPTFRSSDPSLALLDDLADLPIGREAQAPRLTPSRIPPPPPEPP